MGIFSNLSKKRKESDFEQALRYIEEEYPKQALEFERKLKELNAVVDKKNMELDAKISKIESQVNEGFKIIETHFVQKPQSQSQAIQTQMQNTINEYYRRNPATPEEEKEAEEYLRQLLNDENGVGRRR